MSDEAESSGLSGAAGYLLGRMAAQSDHDCEQWAVGIAERWRRPQGGFFREADVHAKIAEWKAAVQSLEATIQRLHEQGAALATERDQWRDYARAVEGEREALRTQASALQDNKFRLLDRVVDLEAENSGLLEDVEMLRAEVARLRNGTD